MAPIFPMYPYFSGLTCIYFSLWPVMGIVFGSLPTNILCTLVPPASFYAWVTPLYGGQPVQPGGPGYVSLPDA